MKIARGFWSPGILAIANCQISTIGLENIPKNEPLIFISNHRSYLDIASLIRTIPINIHFIAKKTLAKIPFLGWYMYVSKAIFIDRSNPRNAMRSLDKAAKLIHEGRSVLIFPEGTRNNLDKLLKFKKGAFILAKKANVKIIPVYIKGTEAIWPANNNKIKSGKVVISFGNPIGNIGNLEINQANDLVREKIQNLKGI